jgi:hypothetical protein
MSRMSERLYRWPEQAHLGRPVPKTKFYEYGNFPAAVRATFVTDVQRIVWAYKLAAETVHLRGSSTVPEIQVFVLEAKRDDIPDPVLTAIDKAVRTPIIFEICRGTGSDREVRMAAAHKHVGPAAVRLSAYYTGGWQPAGVERQPLPTATGLDTLYAALLEPFTPLAARPREEVSEVIARLEAVRKLEREVASLERKLRTEPQLNRKLELRRALRAKQAEMEEQR